MTEQEYVTLAQASKERLYRTAYLYLGSTTEALDAVDEAIYKGFCSYKKVRKPEFSGTWLTRILINTCNTALRRRKRETPMEELPESAAEAFDALPLKAAIERLPQALKDVVILRYFSGLTLAETADALSLPVGTVSTRQRKALSLLRLELSEEV